MGSYVCFFPSSQNRLFVLVTDQGYFDEHQVVFESLDDVDGSSAFYDHNLKEVSAALQSQAAANSPDAAVATQSATTQGLASTQEDQE